MSLAPLRELIARDRAESRLLDYRPYPRQWLFHHLGSVTRLRLFTAGNQTGKTLPATHEDAFHLTGLYPPWWPGRVWRRPIDVALFGESADQLRRVLQRQLFGRLKEIGSGWIPKDAIVDYTEKRSGGDTHIVSAAIRHYSLPRLCYESMRELSQARLSGDGPRIMDANERARETPWPRPADCDSDGVSRLEFLYYTQAFDVLQGDTYDLVHFDEQPPDPHWVEGQARLRATKGSSIVTCSPTKGANASLTTLYEKDDEVGSRLPDSVHVRMPIEEAFHLSDQDIADAIKLTPAHMRDARIHGKMSAGAGAVFPGVRYDDLEVQAFSIPGKWPVLGALDFGIDHPTAAVKVALDPDSDTIYVVREFRQSGATVGDMGRWLGGWGRDMPWAWPRDMRRREASSGVPVAQLFRDAGLRLLPSYATFAEQPKGGSVLSVEAGILIMHERMRDGRLRFFHTCSGCREEFVLYHRDEDGRIAKIKDDLMDALRYAVMMLRYARASSPPEARPVSHWSTWESAT